MACEEQQPFVSCIMPTYNRRQFIPNAIRYFLRQDYNNKELIIIDDGTDAIRDLVPDTQSIRYFRLDQKISLGAKLNLACQYANGKIIANWDDDDWYAARRIKYQVETLQNKRTEICGINRLFYYDFCNNSAYQYIYPPDQRTWLLGSSLCYTKEVWSRNHFADINVGMDALFVWGISSERVTVLSDSTIAVHMIHKNNVSPKKTDGGWWHTYPVEEIEKLIHPDEVLYKGNGSAPAVKSINVLDAPSSRLTHQSKSAKNVYACLVHENEDCVVDLVRNLHYHDPNSTILLYDGSEDSRLIQNHFPYNKFNAVVYPKPVSAKHGYLHTYALNCMKYASDNFTFDSFTIVDSDQLSIRSGYSEYLGALLSSAPNIGMLSSKPKRLNPEDTNDIEVWPAIQAFKEYDLWEPFLRSFSGGEDKFVHWSFWPSTVFTAEAVKDLIQIFHSNKQLQDIMEKTQIWATEEVILPTLVKLLGYDITLNPCSYDYVKYKKSYTLQDINSAFNKTDSYWIHPIERQYENANRKYIREYFNHYANERREVICNGHQPDILFLTLPLLNDIKKIEGWLDDQEADLLLALTHQSCNILPAPHNIVEIGSYHGKSTILFGSVVKAYFPEAKIYAVDVHDGKLGAADQGLHSFPPSFEAFKRNISNSGLSEIIEIIRERSFNVEWNASISLLFIDGLHDYINVSKDFWHFSDWVRPGGYVAFHDYADYFPGVKAFVHELLGMGTYRKIQKVKSLIVLQKL